MSNEAESIREAVLDCLADVVDVPKSQMRDSDRLIVELRIDGDEFSFVFVPELERRLGVKTSQDIWDRATTVGSIIHEMEKLCGQRQKSATRGAK
ncbi:MAG: hypothetical protein ACT4OZ_15025 [Gemmatimonadota bacterium]